MIKRFILPKKQLEKQLNFEKQIIREYQSACYVYDFSDDEKERVERARNNVAALTTLLKNYENKVPHLGNEVYLVVPYYALFDRNTIYYKIEKDEITGVECFVENRRYRTTHYDNVPSEFVFLSYDEAQEKKRKLESASMRGAR